MTVESGSEIDLNTLPQVTSKLTDLGEGVNRDGWNFIKVICYRGMAEHCVDQSLEVILSLIKKGEK